MLICKENLFLKNRRKYMVMTISHEKLISTVSKMIGSLNGNVLTATKNGIELDYLSNKIINLIRLVLMIKKIYISLTQDPTMNLVY